MLGIGWYVQKMSLINVGCLWKMCFLITKRNASLIYIDVKYWEWISFSDADENSKLEISDASEGTVSCGK